MKRIILSIALVSAIGCWPAATACAPVSAESTSLEVPQQEKNDNVKTPPQYAEGQLALMEHLAKTIKYPAKAVEEGTKGTSVVTFTVNTKGRIMGIHVSKPLTPETDAAAVRAVSSLPGKWTPAVNNKGKKVACKVSLPVRFALE